MTVKFNEIFITRWLAEDDVYLLTLMEREKGGTNIDSDALIGVFDTFDDMMAFVDKNIIGYNNRNENTDYKEVIIDKVELDFWGGIESVYNTGDGDGNEGIMHAVEKRCKEIWDIRNEKKAKEEMLNHCTDVIKAWRDVKNALIEVERLACKNVRNDIEIWSCYSNIPRLNVSFEEVGSIFNGFIDEAEMLAAKLLMSKGE